MYKLLLAEHRDYRITLHHYSDMPTEKLIITFGDVYSSLDTEPFALKYTTNRRIDTISVAQRAGTQFQGLCLDDFSYAVAKEADGRDVICYGIGLGGYAAIYYGGAVDARIIAVSPAFPVFPSPKQKNIASRMLLHEKLNNAPHSSRRPAIIYDPMQLSGKEVVDQMIIPAYPKSRTLELPFSGYRSHKALAAAGYLSTVIDALLFYDELIDIKLPTEGSAIWHAEKGNSLKVSDPVKAIWHFKRSLDISPSRRSVSALLALLIKEGDLSEAQRLIDQANLSGNPNFILVPSTQAAALQAGLCIG